MSRHIPGWLLSGSHHHEYEVGLADGERYEGKPTAYLRCTVDQPTGFGTLMQTVGAAAYRQSRRRLSAAVRTDGVQWAGLWMRVDEPAGTASAFGNASAFDNMQDRPIEGTTDWRRYAVVLEVGECSSAVAFGVLLVGGGDVRVADFRLEEVDDDVPTTGAFPARPTNLDFTAG